MSTSALMSLLVTHPLEFFTLLRFRLFYSPKRDITAPSEHAHTGWDRKTMRRCWEFLDMKSKTIGGVIKQLEGDIARIMCIYWVVLRALDIIEDDMTIPEEKKQYLLRSFHELILVPGWKFTECNPNEKLRCMLVEFDVVNEELLRLDAPYREIIVDIAHKMGTGMADNSQRAAVTGQVYIETIADFDLYSYYVAGLVGEGMNRILAQSGKEAPWLPEQHALTNSMCVLFEYIDVIRDYREDIDDQRFLWPREIWGREIYGKTVGRPAFSKMEEMCEPSNRHQALWALSGMIVEALRRIIDTLDYLHLLQGENVFKFFALPHTINFVRMCVCYMNIEVFQKETNIRKAEIASLFMRSMNPKDVTGIYREYAGKLRKSAVPEDPNYVDLVVECLKIELWCEHYYPSQSRVQLPTPKGSIPLVFESGSRTRLSELAGKGKRDVAFEARAREIVASGKARRRFPWRKI
ncbi:uncharacterized protein FIBRA_05558 [Fibroporia radiculosa]|uniref:Squalene synthase n=1 Tax=Fibroporia radiculosa TaxID=599839 RepID=J4HXR2_9APHY|nr:uncharacterized protein FIBRA_05558 [Fibroporia radiculosa]CCM03427.1 predicted protein [Fibroporia radiculosa]